MISRAKPVTKRRRSHWESEERTQFWVTLGFLGLIAVVLLILAGAVAYGYYNDHLRGVIQVNGQGVNKDQVIERTRIALFRLNRDEARVREAVAAGELTQEAAGARLQQLSGMREQMADRAVEDVIDEELVTQLAAERGIGVSDAEVEAALQIDASSPEKRTVQAIFVAPPPTPDDQPSAAARSDARAQAQAALGELEQGKSFADVARKYSTDRSRETGGEYGSIDRSSAVDRAWVDALFALPEGGTTEVVEGADGTFRIGRVTKIKPAASDPSHVATLDDHVDVAAYRDVIRAELLRDRLEEAIVAEATRGPVEQVHAAQVFIHKIDTTGSEGSPATEGDARVAHILYSPRDDPSAAQSLDPKDPSWAAAKAAADAAAKRLRAVRDLAGRRKQFAQIARAESDDKVSGDRGGELGYFTRGGNFVKEFADPVFTGDHKVGDIIGPVKTDFGWHVILLEDRDKAAPEARIARVKDLVKAPGADFAQIAREHSDGGTAADGGDIGWIARYQTEAEVEDVVFGLQPGQVSEPLEQGNGHYVYKALERATRPLDAGQLARIRGRAFESWFTAQKEAAKIDRDDAALAGGTPEGTPEPLPQ